MKPKQNRRLVAIMFTDIEGYTSLMQTDEAAGIAMRQRHRDIFEARHQDFNGEIIQYFGDGTLSIFNNTRDALDCAIAMQKAFRESPKVPLRIGIHTGEIVMVDGDIIGDSVNFASRVESLAESGSIFISSKVYDIIKNQKDLTAESMGLFEFKNVDRAKEVFAISNAGLVVPNPEKLTGKTKLQDFRREANQNFLDILQDLWRRRVFLIAGIYLVALWLLFAAARYLVSNYNLSPYWPDLLIVFFISFLPSVILHSYYHNQLEMRNWRLAEKIAVPSNMILSLVLLFFFFGNKDLGATTTNIVTEDEFGNKIEREVVKNEFRKRVMLFDFKNATGDTTLRWIERGIPVMLFEDLVQSPYMFVDLGFGNHSMANMIKKADAEKYPLFLTGQYRKTDDEHRMKCQFYTTRNGRLIEEQELVGQNLFDLMDDLSIAVREVAGLTQNQIERGMDLPVKVLLTDNETAFSHYILANFHSSGKQRLQHFATADELDPTFAINHLRQAMEFRFSYLNHEMAVSAINKAMEHRDRTSELMKMRIRTIHYILTGQRDKAISIRELALELDPESPGYYESLKYEYIGNDRIEKALEISRRIIQKFPAHQGEIFSQAWALKRLNRSREALPLLENYLNRFPENFQGLGRLADAFLALGRLDEAEQTFNKASLLHPENVIFPQMIDHVHYLKEMGDLNPDFLHPFSGEYHYEESERIDYFDLLDGQLYSKSKRGNTHYIQSYPTNDTTLIRLEWPFEKRIFVKDDKGGFYKFISEQDGKKMEAYRWNESIKKAEALFREGQLGLALEAYKAAYEQNPFHHFLNDYIHHLSFMTSPAGQQLSGNEYQAITGQYDDNHSINVVDGQLFWQEYRNGYKLRLLPISEQEFIVQERLNEQFRLLEKDGQIVGVERTYANNNQEFKRKLD